MSDMISRSELLKMFPVDMENPLWHFTGIRAAIEAAPALDVAPVVHARWVAERERTGHYSHCSKCECRCQGYVPNYKYCPNCGARMDGEADG